MTWRKPSVFVAMLALSVGLAGNSFAEEAAATYAKKCASCHGKDGKGQTKMGEKLKIKDLTDAKVQASFTDDEAVKKITDGIPDEATGKVKMPANKGKLSDDDIKAVAKYVRTLKTP